MYDSASGIFSTLNLLIDSREALTTLLIALITGLGGLVLAAVRQRRRISWSVLYDEPINQGLVRPDEPNMWEITSQGRQIERGSLVVLDVRNTGGQHIEEGHFAFPLYFTFPGRRVEHFKVRDAGDLHDLIQRSTDTLPPDDAAKIVLPELPLNRRAGFKLMVLLTGSGDTVRHGGILRSGRIVEQVKHTRRNKVAAMVGVMSLLVGVTGGVWLANRALNPIAHCTSGSLTIEGSTAFAPTATQVKNAYEQSCPNAAITVVANGSEEGIKNLNSSRGPSQIAMSDGQPSQQPDSTLIRRPVGVVMFAVVANRHIRSRQSGLFNQGLPADQLRGIFSNPAQWGYVAVGRTAVSGTRATFNSTVLGSDGAFSGAKPCGTPDGRPATAGACTEDTTMDVLNYVNKTPNAIGYAEADALAFFPDVEIVPINGAAPTHDNVVSGAYPFVATEYLYTAGAPADLTADYIRFLTDDAMTAELRGHGYIGCSDLHGTKIDGACAD